MAGWLGRMPASTADAARFEGSVFLTKFQWVIHPATTDCSTEGPITREFATDANICSSVGNLRALVKRSISGSSISEKPVLGNSTPKRICKRIVAFRKKGRAYVDTIVHSLSKSGLDESLRFTEVPLGSPISLIARINPLNAFKVFGPTYGLLAGADMASQDSALPGLQ